MYMAATTGTNSSAEVLILDADSRAGLACVQALGKCGVKLHVSLSDKQCLAAASKWARRMHMQPPAEPVDQALSWLSELDARHHFSLIIATTEASLRWFQQVPEDHPLRLKAQLASRESIAIALNKSLTSELAAKLDIPVPSSRLIERGAEVGKALSLPCVLKPVNSKVVINGELQSLAVVVAKDEDARQRALQAWLPYTDVQEQSWVPGHGFGVEVLFQNGKMVRSFVHERLHEFPLSGGGSTLRRSIAPNPRWIEWSCRLLEALNWHGPAMVEWRISDTGQAALMEINPRFWGSLPLTIASGVNMPLDLVHMAGGRKLGAQVPYQVGVIARNLEADVRWFSANLRADRSDPMLLTQPPLRALAQGLRVLWGGECWDGWSWRDPAVAYKDLGVVVSNLAGSVQRMIDRRRTLAKLRSHHLRLAKRIQDDPGSVRNVLVLCHGNICRSAFIGELARLRGLGNWVNTAGLHAKPGQATPYHVVLAAGDLGVDLSQWRSRAVQAQDVAQADLILVMDLKNWQALQARHPQAMAKSTLMGMFHQASAGEVADPYDADLQQAKVVLASLVDAFDALAAQCNKAPTLSSPSKAT